MLTHTYRVPRFIVAVLVLLGARGLSAQTDTSGAAGVEASKRALCWRPRPELRCGGYLVTEFAAERALLSSSDDAGLRFVGTLGPMINRGPAAAWGVLVSFSTDDPDQLGLLRAEGRYRKWLGSTSGIDIALGLTQKSEWYGLNPEVPVQLRGLTAAVGIEQALLGLHARVDVLRGGGESEQTLFAGVRAGGYAGPLSVVTLVVGFFGLMAMAYSGG